MSIDPNDFRVTVGHVSVSANNILKFVLKEECAEKIPAKNTYIVKVQGIEMNNLTRVDKVKIEDGVYEFTLDLSPILPALQNGTNTLEVDGTANMLVTGAGSLDGFYALSCGQTTLSIYSGNGIHIPSGSSLPVELSGFYSRRVIGTNSVIYEKFNNGNKYIIFYYAPQGRWFIKQTISNGVPSNLIFYQQKGAGNQQEVPLTNWVLYVPGGFPPNNCSKTINLNMKACIPFDGASSSLILVNCGGIDGVNGTYYKDAVNGQFVNVRDDSYVIKYVINQQTALAQWQIQDISAVGSGGTAAVLYKSPDVETTGSGACSCLPCCDWMKVCGSSPADPPKVTALEYFDPTTPAHNIRYFDNGASTWVLFDGTTQVATGTSDHYIVVRAGSTSPVVNGAYCLTCVSPNNTPDYTKILDSDVVFGYNPGLSRWEIREDPNPGVSVIYFSPSTDPSVPPFDGWAGNDTPNPLVLSSVIPSCVTWTLL